MSLKPNWVTDIVLKIFLSLELVKYVFYENFYSKIVIGETCA